jgi:hypothetical protein
MFLKKLEPDKVPKALEGYECFECKGIIVSILKGDEVNHAIIELANGERIAYLVEGDSVTASTQDERTNMHAKPSRLAT